MSGYLTPSEGCHTSGCGRSIAGECRRCGLHLCDDHLDAHASDPALSECTPRVPLPTCQVCRKQSDGSKALYGWMLCGTHHDEGLRVARDPHGFGSANERVEAWVHGLREGRFKPCWDAVIEPLYPPPTSRKP